MCGVCIPEAFAGLVPNDHRESSDLSFLTKSLPYNSFADHDPLTSIKSYLYKNIGGGGYSSFAKSFLCHTPENSPLTPAIATDPKTPSRKSFPCHTSETPRVPSAGHHSAFLFVDFPFLHDKLHVFQHPNVFERIPRNRDDVRVFPGLEGSEQIRLAQQIRSAARGGLNGLHRRHAVLHHERKLAGVDSMRANARIRSERHLHSRAHGLREIAPLNLAQVAVVFQEIRRRLVFLRGVLDAFLVVNIHVEVGAMLLGKGDAFVVNERGMLDRGDSGADGILNALGCVRVSFDAQPEVA